ncbi:amino acid permease [Streptomyces sp. MS1.HAVA.3]|uniref:Amino acid permease n=1 Tax=Streptomyces caledonius TaxID=3134107 RepID=A0ABU8UB98_9ACTN
MVHYGRYHSARRLTRCTWSGADRLLGGPPAQALPSSGPVLLRTVAVDASSPTSPIRSDKESHSCSTTARRHRSPPSPAGPPPLLRRKPVEQLVAEGGQGEGGALKRSLTMWQLTMISIGATLGTGIFVVLGEATPIAGPAVFIAFIVAGLTALFSALSYAELAGSIPVSGSSYSYAYATMGELIAWICGWCLILEYGVSVAAVAVGWGQYLNELLDGTLGFTIPEGFSAPLGEGGYINLPALVVVLLCMVFLLRGAKESARINSIMVGVKIVTLVLFIVIGFMGIKAGNYTPLAPLGVTAISTAASMLFFSYIGFDAASTAGEEAKNPKKDLPRAIMLSLLIVTVIYCLVALVAVGAMPWQEFEGSEAALAQIMENVTGHSFWSVILAAGAVVAIASVVFAVLYGQTRILFAMSRDGLMPKAFAKVDAKTGTPKVNTILVCLFCGLLAAFIPLGELANATSIGTLFAFGLVNVAVVILRYTRPEMNRTFKVALFPVTPILGFLFCGYLMTELPGITWLVFGGWMAVGLVIYFFYGMRRSSLATVAALAATATEAAE